jgi:hypothetical protein
VVVAAKIIVYWEEDEEFYSFIPKEAYRALKEWMRYREDSGELINENSWPVRDLWDTGVAQVRGFVTKPVKLAPTGIKRLIERAIWAQGLRKKPGNGKKRHLSGHPLFQQVVQNPLRNRRQEAHKHGETAVPRYWHRQLILYRPTENEILENCLKVADFLAIDNQEKLQKELQKHQQSNQEKTHLIKGRLQEKDEQIQTLVKRQEQFERVTQSLIDSGQLKPRK